MSGQLNPKALGFGQLLIGSLINLSNNEGTQNKGVVLAELMSHFGRGIFPGMSIHTPFPTPQIPNPSPSSWALPWESPSRAALVVLDPMVVLSQVPAWSSFPADLFLTPSLGSGSGNSAMFWSGKRIVESFKLQKGCFHSSFLCELVLFQLFIVFLNHLLG